MLRAIRYLIGLAVLGVILAAAVGPATGAEGAASTSRVPEPPLIPASALPDRPGTKALAATGAAIGTVVYAPFKAVVLCPVMAIASGVSQMLPVRRSTPAHLLAVGCGGTYLITPEMIRGEEEFQGGGGPLVHPERVRPEKKAETLSPPPPRTP